MFWIPYHIINFSPKYQSGPSIKVTFGLDSENLRNKRLIAHDRVKLLKSWKKKSVVHLSGIMRADNFVLSKRRKI